MRKARKGRKRPQRGQSVNPWPDLVTLWALEDDGRRRDRVLARHSLLMTVIERTSLERFRQALGDPQTDWRFHLDAGIGYDLDRLQERMGTAYGTGTLNRNDLIAHTMPLHDRALEALGNARRVARQDGNTDERMNVGQALLDATESLYDRIERVIDRKSHEHFLADGLSKTQAWLERHADHHGKVAAQRDRLRSAQQRHRDDRAPQQPA